MEAIHDFATPIPLTAISELLGVPPPDRLGLVAWSHAIVKLFDRGYQPDEGEAAEAAMVEFTDYLRHLVGVRRSEPADDLISALVEGQADDDGGLTDDELIATCILVLNAGHEATVHAIGNGLLALVRHPEQHARLVADPGLAATAANELLRFDSPLQMFERWVTEEVDWGGHRLAAGSKVGLLFGAANRDPARFQEPERLDLGREDNHHLAFGAGIHRCVGEQLALVELEEVWRVVATRFRRLRLLEEPRRRPSLVFRGLEDLKLEVA